VSNDEICAAIKDIFDDLRSISEPAGALGLAGLKKFVRVNGVRGQTLATVESGANVNFDKLRYVSEQAEIGERREAIYAVEMPETRGSFLELIMALNDHNVTEFNYRFAKNRPARVFLGIQITDGLTERRRILNALELKKYKVLDLTDDDLAKRHVRHMVGGRSHETIEDERVFSIEFPERKGALSDFLESLRNRWNVSLFHYRGEGALYGRALIGVQVEENELKDFTDVLDEVGYRYEERTDNQAYKRFLL